MNHGTCPLENMMNHGCGPLTERTSNIEYPAIGTSSRSPTSGQWRSQRQKDERKRIQQIRLEDRLSPMRYLCLKITLVKRKKPHLSLVYFTGKVVFMAEKMMGGGSCWHKSCFTCLSCNKRLESTSLCEREGEIYCKSIWLLFIFSPNEM